MYKLINTDQRMRKLRQKCVIEGCAKFRSAECTNDEKTCLMLERFRQSGEDKQVVRPRRMV